MSKKFSEWKIEELLFDLGLYEDIQIDSKYRTNIREEDVFNSGGAYTENIEYVFYSEDIMLLLGFMSKGQRLYGYCPICNKELVFNTTSLKLDDKLLKSTIYSYQVDFIDEEDVSSIDYRIASNYENKLDLLNKHRIFEKQAICSFDNNHTMDFIFYINISQNKDEYIIKLSKIGQNPSFTNLNRYKFKKYSKLLKEIKCYDDYIKGINLFSHDIGIGSYVYLRRILEKLLLFKYKENKNSINIDFEEFKIKDMKDKIKILKEYLPDFLNENKSIYNILSAGIHILDEEICKGYFSILLSAIDIILDQELEKREKNQIEEKTKRAINRANSETILKSSEKMLELAGEN